MLYNDQLHVRYVETGRNHLDGPSRGFGMGHAPSWVKGQDEAQLRELAMQVPGFPRALDDFCECWDDSARWVATTVDAGGIQRARTLHAEYRAAEVRSRAAEEQDFWDDFDPSGTAWED